MGLKPIHLATDQYLDQSDWFISASSDTSTIDGIILYVYLMSLIKCLCNLYQNSVLLSIFTSSILIIISVYLEDEGGGRRNQHRSAEVHYGRIRPNVSYPFS